MPQKLIDALDGPMLALHGRIVTMNSSRQVINKGVVYINKGCIVGVRKESEKAPVGFKKAKKIDTDGTIYPGLIELHNHLSYDILPMWQVPKKYSNRSQWGGI